MKRELALLRCPLFRHSYAHPGEKRTGVGNHMEKCLSRTLGIYLAFAFTTSALPARIVSTA